MGSGLESDIHWWWGIGLVGLWPAIKWFIETITGGARTALDSQTALVARSERDLVVRDARVAHLEKKCEDQEDEIQTLHEQIHALRNQVQVLINQMARAGITPEVIK